MKDDKMLFIIGGASGSSVPLSARIRPSPSITTNTPLIRLQDRSQFGVDTTAFGIVIGDVGIFIDNGTGVTAVASILQSMGVKKVYGLQTHFHADHRSGIQTNSLLFPKGLVRAMYAPKLGGRSFKELVSQDFAPETWPISPPDLPIREFEPGAMFMLDEDVPIEIKTIALNHAGGSVGYRIQYGSHSVVIMTDNELELKNAEETQKLLGEIAQFVSDANLVYHDCQYRDREYLGEIGIPTGDTAMVRKCWGHSTPGMIGGMLSQCSSRHLPKLVLLGHHDPKRPDSDLMAFEREVQLRFKGSFPNIEFRFARHLDRYEVN